MGDLTTNFGRHEFACNCRQCGRDTVDWQTLELLEKARAYFGSPITVTSGNRCPDYNRKVGGAVNSQHLYGRAADIKVSGVEPAMVYQYFTDLYRGHYGFGLYRTFVHVDTRSGTPARWQP